MGAFPQSPNANVEALIIRIGLVLGVPYYNYNYSIISPKPYSNYEGPYINRFMVQVAAGRTKKAQEDAKVRTSAVEGLLCHGFRV